LIAEKTLAHVKKIFAPFCPLPLENNSSAVLDIKYYSRAYPKETELMLCGTEF
jgi:hypothetical protein